SFELHRDTPLMLIILLVVSSHTTVHVFTIATLSDLQFIFFFIDTAATDIYSLSLHDAPPLSPESGAAPSGAPPPSANGGGAPDTAEEHTSELQPRENLVCRLLLEKKKK